MSKIYQLNIIKNIKKYYKKKACERYQNLSNEEKGKKQQYGYKLYKNLSDDEKQKLAEYRKNIIAKKKNAWL